MLSRVSSCLQFQHSEGCLGKFTLPSIDACTFTQRFFARAVLPTAVPGAQSQAKCQGRSLGICEGRQLSVTPAKSAVLAQLCQGGGTCGNARQHIPQHRLSPPGLAPSLALCHAAIWGGRAARHPLQDCVPQCPTFPLPPASFPPCISVVDPDKWQQPCRSLLPARQPSLNASRWNRL